jgi:trans-aconitate methyltransferase
MLTPQAGIHCEVGESGRPAAPWYHRGVTDWNARLYESQCSFVWEKAADLVDLLAPRVGERILDLGCGSGRLTQKIAAAGASVVGLDNAPAMLAQAGEQFPELTFVLADATRLEFREPLREGSFDAVFSNAALHWIRPEQAVAANIAALLKPGGRLVAEFGGKENVRHITDAAAQAVTEAGFQAVAGDEGWFYPSIGEYASLVESEGLEVVQAMLFDRPTPQDGGEEGFRLWLAMFGWKLFQHVPPEQAPAVLARTEELLRPALFRDGQWVIDYRRLRVAARKR